LNWFGDTNNPINKENNVVSIDDYISILDGKLNPSLSLKKEEFFISFVRKLENNNHIRGSGKINNMKRYVNIK